MPRATKAMLGAPNVVPLPTAAPRMVDNHRYAGQRRAVRAARQAAPWPGVYKLPFWRERERENRLIADHGQRSPEMLIIMTMFELMPTDQRQALAEKVQSYAAAIGDGPSELAALITRRLATTAKWEGR